MTFSPSVWSWGQTPEMSNMGTCRMNWNYLGEKTSGNGNEEEL